MNANHLAAINDYLVLTIFVIASVRADPAGVIYSLCLITHTVLFSAIDGFGYYFVAAVADLITILSIRKFTKASELSENLVLVSIYSIILNAYGAVIWYDLMSPISYNLAFTMLYIVAIMVLLMKGGQHGRIDRYNRGYSRFWGYLGPRRNHLSDHKK